MSTKNNVKMQVGDWVRGRTKRGELIHGYVTSEIKDCATKIELKVVACDNDRVVGNIVQLDRETVEKLVNTNNYTQTQLEDLIDLALQSNDKEWFMSLTAQLKNRTYGTTVNSSGKNVKSVRFEEARE